MKTKFTCLVLLSLVSALLLTGCVGIIPIPPRSTKVEYGREIQRREVRFIVPGSTTRVEVEQRLGPCSRDCSRSPSIAYTWETPAWTVFWWVAPVIAADGGSFPVGGWHALFVALNDQGVVLQKDFVSLSRRSSLSEQLERWAKHVRKVIARRRKTDAHGEFANAVRRSLLRLGFFRESNDTQNTNHISTDGGGLLSWNRDSGRGIGVRRNRKRGF